MRTLRASLAALATSFVLTAGCRHPNDNVQVDSSKRPPMSEAQRQQIQNDPNLPPGLKGMMMGGGGPGHRTANGTQQQ